MFCNFFSLLPAGSIFFFLFLKALCVCVLITLTVKGSDGIYNDSTITACRKGFVEASLTIVGKMRDGYFFLIIYTNGN